MNDRSFPLLRFFWIIILISLITASSYGQITWDGGGGDINWTTADNWAGNIAPTGGNTLIFSGNTQVASNNTLAADTEFTGLQFTNDGTAPNDAAFTLSGTRITLGGNITTTASSSLLTDLINFDLILNGDRTITTATNHNLTFAGIISQDASSRGLIFDGNGVTRLEGANTFNGGITIRSGATLQGGNNQAFGATSNTITIENGGTLDVGGSFNYGAYGTGSIQVSGAGVGGNGAIINTIAQTNFNHFGNELDLVGDTTFGGNEQFNVTGTIQTSNGNVTLTKVGTNNVVFSGDNRSSNITNIVATGGSIQANSDGGFGNAEITTTNSSVTVRAFNNGNRTIANNITMTGGTFQTSDLNATATYTGTINLNGTTISVGGDDTTAIFTGDVAFGSSGGNLRPNAISRTIDFRGNLDVSGFVGVGTGTNRIAGTTSGTNLLTFNQDNAILSLADGVTVNPVVRNGNGGSINKRLQLEAGAKSGTINRLELFDDDDGSFVIDVVDSDGVLSVNGEAWGDANGSGIVKVGNGTVQFNGSVTYDGPTSIDAGTWVLNGDGSGSSSILTVGTGATFQLNNDFGGTLTAVNGAILSGEGNVAGNVTIGNGSGAGILNVDGSNGTGAANAFSTSGDLDVSNGVIVNLIAAPSSATPVDVITFGGAITGNNTDFTLNNAGNFRGHSFTSAANSIQLSFTSAANSWLGNDGSNPSFWDINTTTNWSASGNTYFDADVVTFDDSASSFTVSVRENVSPGSVTFSNNANVYNVSSNGTATLSTSMIDVTGNADVNLSANISGATVINKSGSGILTLSGTNTNSGNLNVNGGIAIASGGSAINDTANVNLANVVGAEFRLGNDETVGGLTGGGSTGGTVNLQANTLSVGDTDDATFSGNITGSGNLNKISSGTQVLDGSSDYSGTTTVSGGTLQIGSATTNGSHLNTSSVVTVNSGATLSIAGIDNTTFDNQITGDGIVRIAGDLMDNNPNFDNEHITLLNTNNTYTGGTVVARETRLRVTNAGQVGTGRITLDGQDAAIVVADGVNVTNDLFVYLSQGRQQLVAETNATVEFSGNYLNNSTGAYQAHLRADNGTMTLSGVHSGSGLWTTTNGGTYIITGNNTNTGGFFHQSGTVILRNNNAVGLGGTLQQTGSTVSIGNGITISNAYRLVNSTSNKTLRVDDGTGTLAGNVDIQSTGNRFIVQANDTDTLILAGDISGGASANGILKNGTGTVIFTGTNTYSGTTTVDTGTLQIGGGGTSGTLGADNVVLNTNGTLLFNRSDNHTVSNDISGSGTLTQQGANASSTLTLSGTNTHTGPTVVSTGILQAGSTSAFGTNSDVTLNTGTTLDLNGNNNTVGTLAGNGTVTNTSGSATLSIGGGDKSGSFSGTLQNGAGILGLNKVGTGTYTINGPTTYTGNTSVSAGQLNIESALTSSVTVIDGATLGGEGSTSMTLTLGDNSSTGAILDVDAASAGAFTANDIITQVTGGNITVNLSQAPTTTGNITILNFTNSFTGNAASDFEAGTGFEVGRGNGAFAQTANAIVYSPGFENKEWTGAQTNWDEGAGSTASWNGGSDMLFYNGDVVTFGDLPGSDDSVEVTENVNPSSVIFDNTINYTIASAGGNTISNTTINLSGNSTGNVTFDSVIAGSSSILHDGSGTLLLNADNTFTGTTTVKSGATLRAGNAGALGDNSAATLIVEDGGTFDVGGNFNFGAFRDGGITIVGAGVGGNGALVNTGASTFNTFTNEIVLAGNTTFGGTGQFNIVGTIQTPNPDVVITKTGSNNIALTGDNSSASLKEIIINQGSMQTNSDFGFGSADITVNAGSVRLRPFNSGTRNIANNITLAGGSMTILDTGGTVNMTGNLILTADGGMNFDNAGTNFNLTGDLIGTSVLNLDDGNLRLAGDISAFTGRINLAATSSTVILTDGQDLKSEFRLGTNGDQKTLRLETGATSGTVSGDILIAENNAGDFDIDVVDSGATLTISGNISDEAGGGAGIELTGEGTTVFTGTNSYSAGGTTVGANATLQIGNGGSTGTLGGDSNASLSAGSALVFNRDNTYSYGGVISGTGSVTQSGNGTTVLTNDQTYTGTTTVSSGTLLINGNNTAATGAVTVNNGATLGGTGIVGGMTTIESGGTINAGNSPGEMNFAAGLDLNSGSTMAWELVANSTGGRSTTYDAFNVTGGTLEIGSGVTADLNFNPAGSMSAVDWTDAFWSVDYLGTDGWLVFDLASAPTLGSSVIFDTINVGTDRNGIVLTDQRPGASFFFSQQGNNIYLNFTAVPEPSTYALMGLGLAGFGWFVRRRRQKAAQALEDQA